jgi:hypothetical protein
MPKKVQPKKSSRNSGKAVLPAVVSRPIDARTEKQLCKLLSDNYATKNYWILHAIDHITICKQSSGSSAEEMMQIPRKDFNKLIEWYIKEQPVNGR